MSSDSLDGGYVLRRLCSRVWHSQVSHVMSSFRRSDSSHFMCREISTGVREIYKLSFASLGSVLDCFVFFCSAHNFSSYFDSINRWNANINNKELKTTLLRYSLSLRWMKWASSWLLHCEEFYEWCGEPGLIFFFPARRNSP